MIPADINCCIVYWLIWTWIKSFSNWTILQCLINAQNPFYQICNDICGVTKDRQFRTSNKQWFPLTPKSVWPPSSVDGVVFKQCNTVFSIPPERQESRFLQPLDIFVTYIKPLGGFADKNLCLHLPTYGCLWSELDFQKRRRIKSPVSVQDIRVGLHHTTWPVPLMRLTTTQGIVHQYTVCLSHSFLDAK